MMVSHSFSLQCDLNHITEGTKCHICRGLGFGEAGSLDARTTHQCKILCTVNLNYRKPMECLSANKLPTGDQWTYEIKLDGFRVEAVRTESRVILYSRQGKLLTSQFMQVALELEKLPRDTVMDGELVALDEDGVPRFNLLQNYRTGSAHLMYFAFDILLLKGRDVTKLPLSDRRDLLRSVVKRGKHIDLAEWSDKLEALERFAREHRLEGIVAKRANSHYEEGKRTGSWVKLRFNYR